MKTQEIVFEKNNMQVVKEGKKFFTRIFENGESFESGDFNTLESAKKSLNLIPTIEENNSTINEFMGLKPKSELDGVYSFSDMPFFSVRENDINKVIQAIAKYSKYHSDWNWLMPVVEKIKSKDTHNNCVDNIDDYYTWVEIIDKAILSLKKESIYNAVVEFINWYNQQNQ